MEIRTCEEYVLVELEETKENLLKVGESNFELREENKKLLSDLRFVVSLIEKKQYSGDDGYGKEHFFKLSLHEKDYNGNTTDQFMVLNRIVEEYK